MHEISRSIQFILNIFIKVTELITNDDVNILDLRKTINVFLLKEAENHKELIYPVCALLDEKLSQIFQQEWSQYPLQIEHFDEYKAGENFFLKMNNLMGQGEDRVKELSAYYTCLLLGFHGKYLSQHHKELKQIMHKARERLKIYANLRDFSESSKSDDNESNNKSKYLNYSVLSYLFFGSMAIVWLVFKLLSWHQVGQAIEQIHIISMISK